jgi:hypothetical protein
MMKHLIWGKDKAEYFLRRDWTAGISLRLLHKLTFTSTRLSRLKPISHNSEPSAICKQACRWAMTNSGRFCVSAHDHR